MANFPDFFPAENTVLLNRFKLTGKIGWGVHGALYEGFDLALKQSIYVKIFMPEYFVSEYKDLNLFRLFRTRAFIHKNLSPIKDIFVTDKFPFSIQSFAEGLNLRAYLEKRRQENNPLKKKELIEFLSQICSCLSWIHRMGVHGNIKPQNIIISENQIRLTDPYFFAGKENLKVQPQTLPSWEHYAAPEQIKEPKKEYKQSDIYSLALIFGEVLMGVPVKPGVPLSDQGPFFSNELDSIFLKATDPDPMNRFPDIESFWGEIRKVMGIKPMEWEETEVAGLIDIEEFKEEEVVESSIPEEEAPPTVIIEEEPPVDDGIKSGKKVEDVYEELPPEGYDLPDTGTSDEIKIPDEEPSPEVEVREEKEEAVEDESLIEEDELPEFGVEDEVIEPTEVSETTFIIDEDEFEPPTVIEPTPPVPHEEEEPQEKKEKEKEKETKGAQEEVILPSEEEEEIIVAPEEDADIIPPDIEPELEEDEIPETVILDSAESGSEEAKSVDRGGASGSTSDELPIPKIEEEELPIQESSDIVEIVVPKREEQQVEKPPVEEAGGRIEKKDFKVYLAAGVGGVLFIILIILFFSIGGKKQKTVDAGFYSKGKKGKVEKVAIVAKKDTFELKNKEKVEVKENAKHEEVKEKKDAGKKVETSVIRKEDSGSLKNGEVKELKVEKSEEKTKEVKEKNAKNKSSEKEKSVKSKKVVSKETEKKGKIVSKPKKKEPAVKKKVVVEKKKKVVETKPKKEVKAKVKKEKKENKLALLEKKKEKEKEKEKILKTLNIVACPPGMAKLKYTVKVKGKKVKKYFCIDRYEYPGAGSMPKVNVNWKQASKLCGSEGKRLCTAKEWRTACGYKKYPYGNKFNQKKCNVISEDEIEGTIVSTGQFKGCKSWAGIYDMVGNVAEWTQEGYVAGGSANDGRDATCYSLKKWYKGFQSSHVGFRCCADPQ